MTKTAKKKKKIKGTDYSRHDLLSFKILSETRFHVSIQKKKLHNNATLDNQYTKDFLVSNSNNKTNSPTTRHSIKI
jgi:hypothetical protein